MEQSIVDPDAVVAEGFSPGVMPSNLGQVLSEAELANLVAFLMRSR